ncbi:hypothetical protein CH375_14285 [Leptospira ellisii]|uniref:Uncharacterized protein n=1 Tax=Leptospira ellisii TaxID=2023197 RepID=A0A2N0B8C9_9LEPT|nr:hypothetical protein CH379_11480 [Leptospira ellisii]PKA03887.1 hypothetical protein CH375_14285 [Leptospira ellisii]
MEKKFALFRKKNPAERFLSGVEFKIPYRNGGKPQILRSKTNSEQKSSISKKMERFELTYTTVLISIYISV